VPVPSPAYGEVLLRVKASTICGSDIRCIYHEHLGRGPEGYQGVIAGTSHADKSSAQGQAAAASRPATGSSSITSLAAGCATIAAAAT
jgi:threonine dehydrogenase-like Zn-dependent dehydrogenase